MAEVIESISGPLTRVASGVVSQRLLASGWGPLQCVLGLPKYAELALRGQVYHACNQAVITFGTALTATGVTFHLCNPIGSAVDLILLQTSLTVLTASTGGHVVYALSGPHPTAVTAGTALSAYNRAGGSGIGQAKSATTLPIAPVAIRALAGAITAAGVHSIVDNVDGAIVVAPGCQLSVQGITIVGTGLVGMAWAEVPNQ